MKFLRRIVLGMSFIALLAVSGFLYYKTQAVNVELQSQVTSDLRELKQFDTEWNVNLLKSRIGIETNYDSVTMPLLYLHTLEARLGRTLNMTQGDKLEFALAQLKAAFSEKEDLVEQFKSQNALLRNSLHYFPTATEEFKSLLHETIDTTQVQKGLQDDLDLRVNALLTDILRFNLIPDAELGNKIAKAIDDIERIERIERNRTAYPQAMLETVALLIRHARIILQQRMVEDQLMGHIAAVPTAQRMDALSNAFDGKFHDMLNEKQSYRTYLFLYSGLLLLLLAHVVWRLVHSYSVIAKVNKHLQAANETLEQRVAQRTAELEKQSALLIELATHDALTGLINRRQLMIQLAHALQRAERRAWVVGLMFVDLDGFKAVNDTYGHAIGDLALKEVATRVQRHIRQEDSIARFGGDEFVILLDELNNKEGAVRIAEQVLREVDSITTINGHPVQISVSIGISSALGGGSPAPSPDKLLSQADHAMYQAKQRGKGCFCFSDEAVWR